VKSPLTGVSGYLRQLGTVWVGIQFLSLLHIKNIII